MPSPENSAPINGQDSNPPDTKVISDAGKASIDSIVQNAFSVDLPTLQVPTIPLGDNPPTSPSSASFQAPAPHPVDIISNLDSLDSDIDSAHLEGNKSPQALASFEGLKTRYKNKIKEARTQIQNVVTEKEAVTAQLAEAKKFEEQAKKSQETADKAALLENENLLIKQENEINKHFRRRYDLENDPEIKAAYISPMQTAQTSALDIIKNNQLDASLWKDLLSADSEFKINNLIESSDITGLNATSLKEHVLNYKYLKKELDAASSPEYIEASIQAARGKTRQVSDTKAQQVFSSIKTSFADFVSELKESPVNKEHNFFVYDNVIEKAQTYYNSFRSTLGPDFQKEPVMAVLAQAALMSAAYPSQKIALDFYMKEYTKLVNEITNLNSSPSIRQTKETAPQSSSAENLKNIRQAANLNLEDIARDAIKNL